jgi:hypothetical protein
MIVMPLVDLAQSQGSTALRFMIGLGFGSRSAYYDLWLELAEEAFREYQRYVGPVSRAASHLEPYQMEWWFRLSRALADLVLANSDVRQTAMRPGVRKGNSGGAGT